jgi:hypothetical protein
LANVHSTYLAPYYSGTSTETLQGCLTELVNALAKSKADDEAAEKVIQHIEEWADGLYQTEKEILLTAIQKRSHFTFDIIHWIAHVTKILLVVSNAPACEEHTREDLRKHALWLIWVLDWIPDDKEAVTFVENFRVTETLFESGLDSYLRDCRMIAKEVQDILLSWAFKAGKYENGWAILERACYGLATLELVREGDGSALIAAMSDRLAKENAPVQAIRDRAARDIRERAETLHSEGHWSSGIERAMSHVEVKKLRPLLREIANLLSPGTAHETVNPTIF